jgi:hypothetical protein
MHQKNHKYIFLLSGLFLLIFGCKKHSEINTFLSNPGCSYESKIKILLANEVFLQCPETAFSNPFQIFTFEDKLYCMSRENYNQIDVYDLSSHQFIQSIQIDKNFTYDLGGIFVKSPDSIFVYQHMPPSVYLINSQGEIVDKWKMDDAPVKYSLPGHVEVNYLFGTYIANNKPYFQAKNDNLVVLFSDLDIWWHKDLSHHQTIGVYNIKERKWKGVHGFYPDIYLQTQDIMYPYFISHPRMVVSDDFIVVSFPIDHFVYLFDANSGDFIKKVCASSQYLESIIEPLNYEQGEEDPQLRTNLIAEGGYYGNIFYHKDLNYYSRIAFHPQPLKRPDGRLNSPAFKSASLSVFNADFEKIGEVLFEKEDKYGLIHDNIIALGDGFLAFNKRIQSDDTLRYTGRFKFIQ